MNEPKFRISDKIREKPPGFCFNAPAFFCRSLNSTKKADSYFQRQPRSQFALLLTRVIMSTYHVTWQLLVER